MAPTKQVPVVLTSARARGRAATRDAGAPAAAADLGAGAVLGQGPEGRQPDDQRPGRVGAREAGASPRPPRSRRCLVPARRAGTSGRPSRPRVDAKGKPRKQPFFIHRADGAGVAFAGLYEFWRDRALPDDDPAAWLATFTIITTAAEPGLDRIHDRLPLVLDREAVGRTGSTRRRPTPTSCAAARAAAARPVRRRTPSSARSARPQQRAELRRAAARRAELEGVVDPMTGEVIGA